VTPPIREYPANDPVHRISIACFLLVLTFRTLDVLWTNLNSDYQWTAENLGFRLKPVVECETILPAVLDVQHVGTQSDLFLW